MTNLRKNLPQLHGTLCLTDGGLETDLCFNHGIELPEFAAYDLLRSAVGRETLTAYYRRYVEIAASHGLGLVLETPTWRANPDWGNRIGDSPEILDHLNRDAVQLLESLRSEQQRQMPIVISGCLGPRGDGYTPDNLMSAAQARDYHAVQMASFAASNVDMVAALTLNYTDEAIGVALAAQDARLPACISFTVETDGRLPTGEALEDVIATVDEASGGYPDYYMINCAHPTHFCHLFESGGPALGRIKGLRANASCMSHAELDNSTVLDDGDPEAFGRELFALQQLSPHLTVLGGCCGTDHRHIEEVGRHLAKMA